MEKLMVAYQSLSAEAQDRAQQGFMTFYIDHFKHDDLEVLTELGSDSEMAMINHVLRKYNFLTVDRLVKISQRLTQSIFVNLLEKTEMEFDANGVPAESWETWMAKQHVVLRTF